MSKKQTDANKADEYDFSNGVRGNFYRAGAVLSPPVFLDPEILHFLQTKADARGTTLNALVNDLLKRDIELIETRG